jgi:FlaA1/EpsC-like NDP-sugar epimerase
MRNRYFLLSDVALAVVVVFVAFGARFYGTEWWTAYRAAALTFIGIALPLKVFVFWRVGLYGRLWRYASIADLESLLLGSLLAAIVSAVVGLAVLPALPSVGQRIPLSVLVIDCALTAGIISIPRLLLRIVARRSQWLRRRADGERAEPVAAARRVLIAGAGDAGGMIVKEALENPQAALEPIGFLDDDPTKHGHRLHGLPVLGPIDHLEQIVAAKGVDEVVIAMPSAPGKSIRDIVQRCAAAGVRTRTEPGRFELLSGAKAVSALRPIQIEDLLRREPVEADMERVAKLVTGRTILVTGAGGSIGSELCRQLAQLLPEQLVVVGRGENSIFELLQEMRAHFPHVVVKPAIVDVRDAVRLRAVFERSRPFTVFHAAAHKHVPLMEASVDEAILNNVLGTRNVANLCAEFDVHNLVLISTDKAVRPTSIMGATKRVAEAIVCAVAERTGHNYVSVRFGNVLGSRGSVVPTFLRQIARGGPITITHPEMRRYFMTIPEAVQLVLQAATLGGGGDVFVLDMGEPVKISDLAGDLIRLSGLEVGNDIDIEYTGIRPGEKLYEELFFGPDDATPTEHVKILKARDGASSRELDARIDRLIDAARRRVPELELRRLLNGLVPEYQPPFMAPAPEREVRVIPRPERPSRAERHVGKMRLLGETEITPLN